MKHATAWKLIYTKKVFISRFGSLAYGHGHGHNTWPYISVLDPVSIFNHYNHYGTRSKNVYKKGLWLFLCALKQQTNSAVYLRGNHCQPTTPMLAFALLVSFYVLRILCIIFIEVESRNLQLKLIVFRVGFNEFRRNLSPQFSIKLILKCASFKMHSFFIFS